MKTVEEREKQETEELGGEKAQCIMGDPPAVSAYSSITKG